MTRQNGNTNQTDPCENKKERFSILEVRCKDVHVSLLGNPLHAGDEADDIQERIDTASERLVGST